MSQRSHSPRSLLAVCGLLMLPADPALSHASEQGFVLLLPTDFYVFAGTACVALTLVLLAVLPGNFLRWLFHPVRLMPALLPTLPMHTLRTLRYATSCLAFLLLVWLVWIGATGPHDPVTNPLPLFIWTLWWVGFVILQGLLGDLWRWVNPWAGPVAVTRRLLRLQPFVRMPVTLGHAPTILTWLGFIAILLADPAPSDPDRLAWYVGGYWVFTYCALIAFGPRWLYRGEAFGVLMRSYAGIGLFGRRGHGVAIGMPGWQILTRRAPAPGIAVFILIVLGSGSFDGLNETFWWFDLLGINPFEYPGRSALVTQNLAGLVIANTALITVYALAIRTGLALIGDKTDFIRAFCLFAPTILPIALGYHIAHYFTVFLVNGQYALAAASDPWHNGADYLGLGQFYVTTGFFNTRASMQAIWLTQAGAVVGGHVLAVMLAHAIARRQFGSNRRATLAQAPLAAFMVFYTLFGLWLLASPRGG